MDEEREPLLGEYVPSETGTRARNDRVPPSTAARPERRQLCSDNDDNHHCCDGHHQKFEPACSQQQRRLATGGGQTDKSTWSTNTSDPSDSSISSSRTLDQPAGGEGPSKGRGLGGKSRLALITVVSFFVSCAGKLHGPVLTQYVYQLYTEKVYGNQSVGIHVSRNPCLNQSQSNSSLDPRSTEVQDKSADLLMQLDMVSGALSVLINVFLGSYSDLLGRRLSLLLPIVGHFLRNATTPVIVHWHLGVWALYVGYAMDGLFGGYPGIVLGLYAYTADITTADKQRTLGMSIMETSIGLALALTNLAGGYFIEETGVFYPSLLGSLLLLVAAFVVWIWVPETMSRDRKQCLSPLKSAKRVFDIFVPSGGKSCQHVLLLLLALLGFFLAQLPYFAGSKLRSLYVMDHPFCWSSVQIGFFECARDGASRIASLIFILLLRGYILTPLLAIMGALSSLGGDMLFALAFDDLMIYMVALVNMASSMLFPSLRSIMSRMVSAEKQGALFSAIAVVESLCYCLGQLTFLTIYRQTAAIFHGFVFFILGGFHTLIIVLMIIYLCFLRRMSHDLIQPISIQTEGDVDS